MYNPSEDYNELLSLLKYSTFGDKRMNQVRLRFDAWYVLMHNDYDIMVQIINSINKGLSDKEITEMIKPDWYGNSISNRLTIEMDDDLLKYNDMSAVAIEIQSARESLNDACRKYNPSPNVETIKITKSSEPAKTKSRRPAFVIGRKPKDIIVEEKPVYPNRYNELLAYIKSKKIDSKRKEALDDFVSAYDGISKETIDILANKSLSNDRFEMLIDTKTYSYDSKFADNAIKVLANPKLSSNAFNVAVKSISLRHINLQNIRYFVNLCVRFNVTECSIDHLSKDDMYNINHIMKNDKSLFVKYIANRNFYVNSSDGRYIMDNLGKYSIKILEKISKYIYLPKNKLRQIELGFCNGLNESDISIYEDMRYIEMWISRMLLEHGKSIDSYMHILNYTKFINEECLRNVLEFMFDVGFSIEIMMKFLTNLCNSNIDATNYTPDKITEFVNKFMTDMNTSFAKFSNSYYNRHKFSNELLLQLHIYIESGIDRNVAQESIFNSSAVKHYDNSIFYSRISYYNQYTREWDYNPIELRDQLNKMLSKTDVKIYERP